HTHTHAPTHTNLILSQPHSAPLILASLCAFHHSIFHLLIFSLFFYFFLLQFPLPYTSSFIQHPAPSLPLLFLSPLSFSPSLSLSFSLFLSPAIVPVMLSFIRSPLLNP